jgi:hypothetical protein
MMAQPNCFPPRINRAKMTVNILGKIATKAKAKIIQDQTESIESSCF